jgi:hypothetical protein
MLGISAAPVPPHPDLHAEAKRGETKRKDRRASMRASIDRTRNMITGGSAPERMAFFRSFTFKDADNEEIDDEDMTEIEMEGLEEKEKEKERADYNSKVRKQRAPAFPITAGFVFPQRETISSPPNENELFKGMATSYKADAGGVGGGAAAAAAAARSRAVTRSSSGNHTVDRGSPRAQEITRSSTNNGTSDDVDNEDNATVHSNSSRRSKGSRSFGKMGTSPRGGSNNKGKDRELLIKMGSQSGDGGERATSTPTQVLRARNDERLRAIENKN